MITKYNVKFLGAENLQVYNGTDHETGEVLTLFPGDSALVSGEKLKQLKEDFPKAFQQIGEAPKPTAPAPAVANEPSAVPVTRTGVPPKAKGK